MASVTLEEVLEETQTLPEDEQESLRRFLNMATQLMIMSQALDMCVRLQMSHVSQQQIQEVLNAMARFTTAQSALRMLRKLRALEPDEQQKLLDIMNEQTPLFEQSKRAILSRTIRGKYSHIPTSSDQFALLKQEEIQSEDRRR
jgi:hypothetical protein